jgi:hypothetical protein
MAHPLGCVLAALDGSSARPEDFGVGPGPDAEAISRAGYEEFRRSNDISRQLESLREDVKIAFGEHPVDPVAGCPICNKLESAAHYCEPREAARARLREFGEK